MADIEPLAYRPQEAAKLLGCSAALLEKMRRLRTGPAFVRPDGGRCVFYTREELVRWLHSREVAEIRDRDQPKKRRARR